MPRGKNNPTIKISTKDEIIEFDGKPTVKGLEEFIKNVIGTDKFKTHDDTARLQLVNNKSNAFLNKILEITTSKGAPILINTSLNAKGKPIVNSVEDFKNEVNLF